MVRLVLEVRAGALERRLQVVEHLRCLRAKIPRLGHLARLVVSKLPGGADNRTRFMLSIRMLGGLALRSNTTDAAAVRD